MPSGQEPDYPCLNSLRTPVPDGGYHPQSSDSHTSKRQSLTRHALPIQVPAGWFKSHLLQDTDLPGSYPQRPPSGPLYDAGPNSPSGQAAKTVRTAQQFIAGHQALFTELSNATKGRVASLESLRSQGLSFISFESHASYSGSFRNTRGGKRRGESCPLAGETLQPPWLHHTPPHTESSETACPCHAACHQSPAGSFEENMTCGEQLGTRPGNTQSWPAQENTGSGAGAVPPKSSQQGRHRAPCTPAPASQWPEGSPAPSQG